MRERPRAARILVVVVAIAACTRRDAPREVAAAVEAGAEPVAKASPVAHASADAGRPEVDAGGPRRELPLGGREVFPAYRLVGFCGTPGAPKLGRLAGNLGLRAKAIDALAKDYGDDRKTLKVFELIAVVVQGEAGQDGKHRRRVSDEVVEKYLQGARDAKALLLLDIQPGRSDFLTELKHYERFLREPDVGVALDPEWAMTGKEAPGARFGQTSGDAIMEVATWLASIVAEGDLPEKVLVFHQVNDRVLVNESVIAPVPGVAIVKSVDGLGHRANKIRTYDHLMKATPPGIHAGFKLFFEEDTRSNARLMRPAEVLALEPRPELVVYE